MSKLGLTVEKCLIIIVATRTICGCYMKKEELKIVLLNIENKNEIKNIDKVVEKIWNKYYKRRIEFQPLLASKIKLSQMIIEGVYPNVKKWDKIAVDEGYLSHKTIEYIENCDWRDIEIKLLREIKKEIRER